MAMPEMREYVSFDRPEKAGIPYRDDAGFARYRQPATGSWKDFPRSFQRC